MSHSPQRPITVVLSPSINNLNLRAVLESGIDLSDSPSSAVDPDRPSKQLAGSMTHFILAASLNFIGIFMSCIIKTPGQALFVPCSLGLSVNCVLVSISLWAFVAIRHTWSLGVVVCGCIAMGALAVSVFLAVGAYRSMDLPGSERGLASEFVFYMVLGLLTPPFGLFAMFHPSRRANLGSALGTATSICIAVPCLCWAFLGTPGIVPTIIYGAVWAGFLPLLLLLCYRDDLSSVPAIAIFVSLIGGPFGFILCLGGSRIYRTLGLLGFLCFGMGLLLALMKWYFSIGGMVVFLVCWFYLGMILQRKRHGERFVPF